MTRRTLFLFLFLALIPLPSAATANAATADETTWYQQFGNRVVQTWTSPTWDIYVPFLTWHNRLTYDSNKTDKYNENPWGFGIGKSMYDEDGDWHSLYAMGFQDSHDMFEPIVGYAFLKNWQPSEGSDWRIGGGFTLGITARQQYNYIPLPLPLPMAGIEYKRLAIQAVYIPGTYNNGNVLFCWLRWQLN